MTLKGKHEASANAFHCKEHFHGAYVCLVGTFQAKIKWLLAGAEGPCNLMNYILAFE